MQNVNNFLKEIEATHGHPFGNGKNKELNIYLHLNSEAMKQAEEIDLKIKDYKFLFQMNFHN